mgnify:CR=1 FL=1
MLWLANHFKGTVADNVLEWGTGGINIDDCRIETTDNLNGGGYGGNNVGVATYALGDGRKTLPTNKLTKDDYTQPEGRFPANIIFDEEAGKILDEQSGITYSGPTNQKVKYGGGVFGGGNGKVYEANSGGASRFFYCPKASKKDRDVDNIHPTVKPTDLMAYLIRLVTPKGGVVLDPFTGSGSTGKAAVREGMNFIGIEREEEYFHIAKQRIEQEVSKKPNNKFWD